MSSAYGVINTPNPVVSLSSVLPLHFFLNAGEGVKVVAVDKTNEVQLSTLHGMLNEEIQNGNTYPQEHQLNLEEWRNYFLTAAAFVALSDNGDTVYGTFYIKPNFPGRCSHICNGGFITHKAHRGKGVGIIMANSFLSLAPLLGYRASMFNLVFENNVASVKLWRKLQFVEIGRVPKAGRLKKQDSEEEEFVDAIMFYKDFGQN